MSERHAWTACLLVIATISSPLYGQDKKKEERLNTEGQIDAIVPGYIKLTTKDKKTWIVQVSPKSRDLRLVGSADPRWLKPGMLVTLQSRFTDKGKPVAPVGRVTVFTPSKDYKAGLVADRNLAEGISFTGEGKKKPANQPTNYKVTGQLRALSGKKMTVVTPQAAVQVELADDVSISVDIADIRAAKPGDKVTVRGRIVAPGKAVAQSVRVTPANPLGGTASKPKKSIPGPKPESKE